MPDFIDLTFLAPFWAFFLVVVLAIPASKLAKAIELVDKPGGRKNHEKPIPPIGGLIIFPVFMIVLLMAGGELKHYWPFYVSLIILLVTGALDDRFSINAWLKFVAHFSAAAIVVLWGNCQVAYLGDLFGLGTIWSGVMSIPFSMVAVVLLINAVNLMDGLDGLAGGKSVVMFGWFAVAAGLAGYSEQVLALLILIATVCGFLVFNMRSPWRRSASMFLGDSGSMCLGLAIAWFAIHLARYEQGPLEPISVAWIIGLPIFDACAQFYRRVRNGRHPFTPDRGHFHYHFLNAGYSVQHSTWVIMGVVFVMGLIGYGGYRLGIPGALLALLWIFVLFGHMALSYKPEHYKHILSHIKDR